MICSQLAVKETSGCAGNNLPEDILRSSEPVVLRGLVADWPAALAAQASAGEFCDYLKSFDCGGEVGCFRASSDTQGRYFYSEDMMSLNFTKSMIKLDSFLGEVVNSTTSGDHGYWYSGSESIDRILPGFCDDNDIISLNAFKPRKNIWIGNQSRIAAHFDMPSNIACCVSGRRRFSLLPPDQIENLYPGPLDFTPSGQSVSLVDFHNPDFAKYPRFRQALEQMRVVELNPGDALFIPGMWWHHVEGLSDFNVLVNFWWWCGPAFTDAPINALYYAMMNIKDLSPEQKSAWKVLFDFYVFNDDVDTFDYIPEAVQGRLGTMNEDSARYIRSLLLNVLNR